MDIRALLAKYRAPVTFAAIGCLNTLVDWGVYAVLFRLTAVIWLSQTVGYSMGLVCSFILNRNLTFRGGRGRLDAAQVLRFVCVNAVTLLVGMGAIYLMVRVLAWNAYLAKLLSIILTWPMNYFGYQKLVFNQK